MPGAGDVLMDLILAFAPALFGGTVWRRQGASWAAILSWTVPVTVLLAVGLLYANGALRFVLVVVGAALFTAMMLSPTAIAWWERHVLRTRV